MANLNSKLMRERFRQHVGQTSDNPLAIQVERAEGVWLYGPDEKRWMDLISGIGVSSLGHAQPSVVEAVQKQAGHYMHTMVYGEFVQPPQVELASRLAELLPDPLSSTFFVNSGSEATEGALKLAKRYTGRTRIACCHKAYHGATHGAMSLGGEEYWKAAFRPLLPDVIALEYGSKEDLDLLDENTACFILETVQGEAGVLTADSDYFQAVRQRCSALGILLILDEIQCGMGRTGELFAFQAYDIIPDILLLGKAFGGGMPLGAFVASEEVMQVLQHSPVLGHISTFGGHPVCCAAGLAALNFQLEHRLWEAVSTKEARFRAALKHPAILEFRSKGLMIAIRFDGFDQNKAIIDHCLENGVLTDWFLWCDDSLRIAPPLTITNEEIDWACARILEAVEACS
jgi:acetylornithine/succinyldiaminopimelate/putrescine aminotransferase